ncbi:MULTISPECIES: ATP-binding protein [Cyanophyceae]|uniref:histidine kinase n=1 Tax=Stenomitos frigidus AS-A4 TaxID=2933935 RepID=A0ABV0KRJ9_9CYAN|nr:ATP-binding protein [Phormidium sp. FACHB-592]
MIQDHSVAEQLFAGKGEMAMRMRSHDWSQTPVGSVQSWSQSLKSLIKTLLTSRYPMVLTWGAEFTQFYNDAYSQLIGDKHPAALGTDIRETLAEAWDTLGPMIQRVMATGVANWTPALLLLLERAGYREESYFSVSHAPAEDDAGQIVGMLAVCSEVTQQVLGERQLRLLRDLAAQTGETRSVQDTCQDLMAAIAAHPLDVPLALLYLRESDGKTLTLQGTVGLAADEQLVPDSIALTTDAVTSHPLWSLAPAASGETILVEELDHHMTVPGGPWNEPVHTALMMPIASSSQTATLGVLVTGVNPNRALDEGYRSFYELLIGQVSLSIRNAQAYEEERRRAEMLAELDRAKTAFFSNVSHEFRTPLTLMLGPLEELSNTLDGQLQPDQREQLQLIQRNGLRLQKLVNTLLDFSRIEAERVQASYEPTDLAAYTAELASMFRSLIERTGMSLSVDCPALPAPVYVDRDLWEKVVLNLMSNAFKFTFTGSITVRLQPVGNAVALSVTDTGVGIPEAELPRLFERFHRVSGTRSRTYEGSGIGLSFVQELVKLHGGTIRVTSQVDCGTTFTIAIPFGTTHLPQNQIEVTRTPASTALGANPYLAEASRWIAEEGTETQRHKDTGAALSDLSASPLLPFSTSSDTSPVRILLADDNADMRDYVKRLLSQYCEVETVTNGLEALQAIAQRLPDLVLSDVMMPGLDGFGLLRELRANPRTKEIPMILLSARAGEESRIEGLEAGADDYLIKPFSARELLARVEASLKLGQLRKAAAQQKQEALRVEAQTARDNLESLLARIDDQFLALDREWRYTYVNDRVTEVTGVARENLLGRSLWEVFPETVNSQFEREVHRAITEQTPVQFEYFYPQWNRWFENHVYPSADGVSIIVTEITARKQAEAQLRESEKFLQAINETAPNLLYIFDLNERRNVYVSPQIFPMLGVLPADVQVLDAQLLVALFHPDDIEHIEQHHDRMQAAREDDIFTIEYRLKHASGKWLWLSSRDTIFVRDEQGKPTQILGSAIDITDRKQAELMLSEQKRLLELIATNTPLDDCLTAVCRSISQLNPGIRACFLLTDAQGLTFSRSITPDLAPSFRQELQAIPIHDLCLGTGGEAVYRSQPITRADTANDGLWSQEWRELCVAHGILACHSSPIRGLERSPVGSLLLCFSEARTPTDWEYQLAAFGTQIASIAFERDYATLTLRQSEERYRLLAEAIPQLVWMTDTDGQNEYVNQRFCDYTGLTTVQLHGLNWLSILHPDDLAMTHDRWLAAVKSGQAYEIEYRFRRADGSYRWFLGQGIPLKDEQGQVYKWFGTCTDIEPQKQIEQARLQLLEQEQAAREQAETANRIKDEFLAVLSHELRSPLNPILGWSKLLRNGKLDATRTTQALETIERNAQLQVQLIDDLLDISRILRGKLVLTVTPVDLNFVISAALETVRLAAEAKSLQVQTIISPIISTVKGDAGRLQQVVWNLLSNAVKFTPVGGHITIELCSVGTKAQIQVKDTGKGIKPDFLPYIFEHFRQEDGATTRKFGGLGLGLAIARQIVEMHGGTVKAESQGEGMGATFIVELPLSRSERVEGWRSEGETSPLDPSLPHPLTGLHILLVDDETDTREFQAFVLEQGGANVIAVAAGFEALQALDQFTPDVLVSDIGMAEMDGYMLMQQLRSRLPNQGGTIPAIALTAYARDTDQQQAFAAGFQMHLTKPVEPETLISAIVSLLKKSRTSQR